MTHIVGDGRLGVSERVFLDGQLFTNPFVGAEGPKWDNPTFPLTSIPPPLDPGGASVVVKVAPNGLLSDCLCYSGIVLSTQVQDSDGDGLLDIWETSPSLVDPNGQPLPNLDGHGREPGRTRTSSSRSATWRPSTPNHLWRRAQAGALASADARGPEVDGRRVRESAQPINVHFDVGNGYPQASEAEPYIIRGAGLARGGEAIDEMATVCTPGEDGPAVGVPVLRVSRHGGLEDRLPVPEGPGLQRDAEPPLTTRPRPSTTTVTCPGNTCDTRFDRNRKDMFR